jgi:hypothetical protein
MTLAVDTQLFAITGVFAFFIAGAVVGYTLHARSLCRQVVRARLDRSRALAGSRLAEPATEAASPPIPAPVSLATAVRYSAAQRLLIEGLRSERLAAVARENARSVAAGARS